MQVTLKVSGVEMAKARLAAVNRAVDPVLRGALNTTATSTRRERYNKPLRGTLPSRLSNDSMRIKRARRGMMNSRVIPSSSGVPVTRYASWGYDPIDKTRARLWVRGPNGRKIAAGFVNPSSAAKQPWRTKRTRIRVTDQNTLNPALGPSVAYWFRKLSGKQTTVWVNAFLQREFEKRLQREIAKGAR